MEQIFLVSVSLVFRSILAPEKEEDEMVRDFLEKIDSCGRAVSEKWELNIEGTA